MSFLGFGKSTSENDATTAPAQAIPAGQAQIVDQIKAEIGNEIATEYAKSLMGAINDNCFELCVKTPSASLSGEKSKCVDDCTTKFIKAWSVVSQSYMTRIKKE